MADASNNPAIGNMFRSWVVVIDSPTQGPHVLYHGQFKEYAVDAAADYLIQVTLPRLQQEVNSKKIRSSVQKINRLKKMGQSAEALDLYHRVRPAGWPFYDVVGVTLNRFNREEGSGRDPGR